MRAVAVSVLSKWSAGRPRSGQCCPPRRINQSPAGQLNALLYLLGAFKNRQINLPEAVYRGEWLTKKCLLVHSCLVLANSSVGTLAGLLGFEW